MNAAIEYARLAARFPFALRRFLRQKLTLDEARRIVRESMARRTENFLRVVEQGIYANPGSPYLAMLRLAQCELGDLRVLVRRMGVEDALRHLRAEGVYVTFEEYKGRVPIVRYGQEIPSGPTSFDNPNHDALLYAETGGSSGTPTRVLHDLAFLVAKAPHNLIAGSAHGVLDAPEVIWRGILPDGTIRSLLTRAYYGQPPARWFSHIGLREQKGWVANAFATYYILLWMRLLGASAPFPRFAPVDRPQDVLAAIVELLKTHGRCALRAPVSRALRICLEAQEREIDLTGLTVLAGSEPATPAKVRGITRSGARYLSNYGSVEAGKIGVGCPHSADGSDVHLVKDAFALFAHPHEVEGFGVVVPAFYLTTLLPAAPKLLLNYRMDDYGVVEERSCGCELETYGYTTHLREIRSYSKLTGEGVTLIGNELIRILEEVLPARFGGSAMDYQFLEQEDAQGLTRLRLVVSPRVDLQSEQEVVDCLMQSLGESSGMGDAARVVWSRSGALEVVRQEPVWSARGKLSPLHIERSRKDNR